MQAIELETTISPQGSIALPESYQAIYGRSARMILLLDDLPLPTPENVLARLRQRRTPPPQFAGKVRELGDVMSSVPPADWGITE